MGERTFGTIKSGGNNTERLVSYKLWGIFKFVAGMAPVRDFMGNDYTTRTIWIS
jgi:hypothetical protein